MENKKNQIITILLVVIILLLLAIMIVYYHKNMESAKVEDDVKEVVVYNEEKWFNDNQKLLTMLYLFSFKDFEIENANEDTYLEFVITYMKYAGKKENNVSESGNYVSILKSEVSNILKKYFKIDSELLDNVIRKLDTYKVDGNGLNLDFYLKDDKYYLNYAPMEWSSNFYFVNKKEIDNKKQLEFLIGDLYILDDAIYGYYKETNPISGLGIITLDKNYKIEKIKYLTYNE